MYVKYTGNAIAHIQTVVPQDEDGNFDMSFSGMEVQLVPFGPPQSSRPHFIRMTKDQFKRMRALAYQAGSHQELCKRVAERSEEHDGHIYATILATDMKDIEGALSNDSDEDWVKLFREIKAQANASNSIAN